MKIIICSLFCDLVFCKWIFINKNKLSENIWVIVILLCFICDVCFLYLCYGFEVGVDEFIVFIFLNGIMIVFYVLCIKKKYFIFK